jgi:hypothetical protein
MTERVYLKVDMTPLKRLARIYPELAAEETVAVMQMVLARVEGAVMAKTPVGVGGAAGLRGSINGQVLRKAGEVVGLVGSPLPHADPVEFGSRPHMPPARPLILWASRVLGLSGRELRSAVRGIQWKIYRHGTKGHHMFGETFEELDGWIMGQLETIVPRIAGRIENAAG